MLCFAYVHIHIKTEVQVSVNNNQHDDTVVNNSSFGENNLYIIISFRSVVYPLVCVVILHVKDPRPPTQKITVPNCVYLFFNAGHHYSQTLITAADYRKTYRIISAAVNHHHHIQQ